MAEFVGGEVKYVKVGEPVGIAPLPKPIATVKFDVRSPGIYKVEVRQDGSWIAVREKGKSSMKFEVPENCGLCLSIEQFGNKYICGMPVSKEKEILDISAFEVDINSRPDWCPKK